MSWMIVALPMGDIEGNQRLIGPYSSYELAEQDFAKLGPAGNYQHKYIEEITTMEEMLGEEPILYGQKAFESLKEEERGELWDMLVDEAADMSTKDRVWQMLDGMGLDEMREYLDGEEE